VLQKACDGQGGAAGGGQSFGRHVVGDGFDSSGWSFGRRMLGGDASTNGVTGGGGFSSGGRMSPQRTDVASTNECGCGFKMAARAATTNSFGEARSRGWVERGCRLPAMTGQADAAYGVRESGWARVGNYVVEQCGT
jgi:hypothetical protein